MPVAADNDVVSHFDAEDAARFHEALRHAEVGINRHLSLREAGTL